MKVRYVGKSFGIDSMTDQKEYEVLDYEADIGALRIVDDSGEDYLYDPVHPHGGHFEIVEDDEFGTLHKAIYE